MSLADLVRKRDDNENISFIGLLDDYLNNLPWKYKPGYHPSSISYKLCPRQEALIQLGYLTPVKNVDAKLERIFATGHALHDRYQRWSRKMGVVAEHERFGGLAQEVRLKHPVGISGRCDDILELEDGYWDVVDYKSMNHNAFATLIQPLEYHEKQLIVYLGLVDYLFDGKPPKNLRGRLVYECKSTQDMKEFVLPWSAERKQAFEDLIALLTTINEAVAEDDPLRVPCNCGVCEKYDIDALRESARKVRV